ncbi:MAG: YceI family protein [Planctomycetes bacterium]|nr:YceI family protein [Planctomycetota bacterium]
MAGRSLIRLWCLLVLTATSVRGDQASPTQATTPAEKNPAETYQIDAVHSTVLFRATHLGVGPFWGRFKQLSGSIEFTPGHDGGLALDVQMAIASVDSGSERLDGHLKSPDFFDASKFPQATFKSTGSRRLKGDLWRVSGALTMRGVTKPIEVDVRWLGSAQTSRGRRCGLETEFTVDRHDYGVGIGMANSMVGNQIRIIVGLEAMAAAPDAAEAAGADAKLPQRLAQFDTNKDGKLQKDEAPERMGAFFDRLDTNGDGAIDPAEFASRQRSGSARGRRPQDRAATIERLKGLDDNEDGKIERQEVPPEMTRLFDRIDANDDDVVDQAELEAAEQRAEDGTGGD